METAAFSGYDKKSGIRWKVSNDENSLFLEFDTDNRGVQRNILIAGVKIYIDTTGKKKEGMYLHYPYREGGMRERPDMRPPQDEGMEFGAGPDRQQAVQRMTIRIPGKALWVSGDGEYHMDLQLEKTDFSGSIAFDSAGYLIYHASIPLKLIFPAGRSRGIPFACGIAAEGIIRSPGIESDGFGGTRGSGQGGFPGSGQGGGNYGGGQGRGQGGGPPAGQRPSGSISSGTEIWFQTELAKPGITNH